MPIRPFKVSLPPRVGDPNVEKWMRDITNAINGIPFSVFSTADGPNSSNVTAPEGFLGIEIGSGTTRLWVKQSGSDSAGWSALSWI